MSDSSEQLFNPFPPNEREMVLIAYLSSVVQKALPEQADTASNDYMHALANYKQKYGEHFPDEIADEAAALGVLVDLSIAVRDNRPTPIHAYVPERDEFYAEVRQRLDSVDLRFDMSDADPSLLSHAFQAASSERPEYYDTMAELIQGVWYDRPGYEQETGEATSYVSIYDIPISDEYTAAERLRLLIEDLETLNSIFL